MRLILPPVLLAFALVVTGCADEFATDATGAATAKAAAGAAKSVCFIDGPGALLAGSTAAYEAEGCPSGTGSWSTSGPLSVPAGSSAPFVNATAGSVTAPASATLRYVVRGRRGRVLASVSKAVSISAPVGPPAISGLSEVTHIPEYGGCAPSYNATNGPVSWSVSGPATFSASPSGSSGILTTTGFGTVTITATNGSGSATKTVTINRSGDDLQCP